MDWRQYAALGLILFALIPTASAASHGPVPDLIGPTNPLYPIDLYLDSLTKNSAEIAVERTAEALKAAQHNNSRAFTIAMDRALNATKQSSFEDETELDAALNVSFEAAEATIGQPELNERVAVLQDAIRTAKERIPGDEPVFRVRKSSLTGDQCSGEYVEKLHTNADTVNVDGVTKYAMVEYSQTVTASTWNDSQELGVGAVVSKEEPQISTAWGEHGSMVVETVAKQAFDENDTVRDMISSLNNTRIRERSERAETYLRNGEVIGSVSITQEQTFNIVFETGDFVVDESTVQCDRRVNLHEGTFFSFFSR